MGFSDLPDASGIDHKKMFEKFGWVTRRTGEHIILTHPRVSGVTLAIPNHRTVKRATLHALIRAAGLTDRAYREVFDGR